MNKILTIISFTLLCLTASNGWAQEEESDCVLTLKDAERLYDQGKLEVIPKLLDAFHVRDQQSVNP